MSDASGTARYVGLKLNTCWTNLLTHVWCYLADISVEAYKAEKTAVEKAHS